MRDKAFILNHLSEVKIAMLQTRMRNFIKAAEEEGKL